MRHRSSAVAHRAVILLLVWAALLQPSLSFHYRLSSTRFDVFNYNQQHHHDRTQQRQRVRRCFPSRSALWCTRGLPTTDVIEPAKYRSDLYEVLGILRNTSAKDVKQAYWNIALNTHPDRNASIEALYIFQNASYAYSVLGRDPRKRQEYDTRLETSEFINTLGQVSNDVGSVAVPLLNMTYNAALPFLKDALDFSTAAFEALVDEQTDMNGANIFDRIKSAFGIKGVEQRIRRSTEQLQGIMLSMNVTQRELSEAMAIEKTSKDDLERISNLYQTKENVFQIASSELKLMNVNFSAVVKEENTLKTALKQVDEEIDVAMKRSQELDGRISRTTLDIAELEVALRQKLAELFAMKTEEATSLVSLELNESKAKELKDSFNQQSALRAEVESAFKMSEQTVRIAQGDLSLISKDKAIANDVFSRQSAYLQSLQTKLTKLTTKVSDLETSIDKDYRDWMKSKEDADQERIRLADIRRRQEEDEAYAAEVAQMEALKVRVEKRNREMQQMDSERIRLEALAKEEIEMVRVAEEKLRSKNRS